MPDETTFELASIHFGAEPVAVFRFGYERFELRARLGPGNLEHAIAAAAEVAASVFAKMVAGSIGLRAAGSRGRGRSASTSLVPRVTNHCSRCSPLADRPHAKVWISMSQPPLTRPRSRPRGAIPPQAVIRPQCQRS